MAFREDDHHRQNLQAEYRMLNDAIWKRGQSVWLVNSVLIPSSILIILEATIYRESIGNMASGIISLLSVLLSMYCLLFYASSEEVNKICFERIHAIEHDLGMPPSAGNTLIRDEVRRRWWYPVRNYQWYVFLIILVVVNVHIAVLNLLGWKLVLL
jgi:hypothetical protein